MSTKQRFYLHCVPCASTFSIPSEDIGSLRRGLAASLTIVRGEVLGSEQPFVSVLVKTAWFRTHHAHRIRITDALDGNGRIDALCAEPVRCECGSVYPCTKPDGHTDPHGREQPTRAMLEGLAMRLCNIAFTAAYGPTLATRCFGPAPLSLFDHTAHMRWDSMTAREQDSWLALARETAATLGVAL